MLWEQNWSYDMVLTLKCSKSGSKERHGRRKCLMQCGNSRKIKTHKMVCFGQRKVVRRNKIFAKHINNLSKLELSL